MKNLDLCGISNIFDLSIVSAFKAWSLLTEIGLSRTRITDSSILALCKHCPLVRKLSIGDCSITSATLIAVADNLTALTDISLENCPAATDNNVELIVYRHGHKLESISLNSSRQITGRIIVKIAVTYYRLKWVRLSCCRQVTMGALRALLEKCSKLRYVDLEIITNIKESGENKLRIGFIYVEIIGYPAVWY
jgi:hypothetical protein